MIFSFMLSFIFIPGFAWWNNDWLYRTGIEITTPYTFTIENGTVPIYLNTEKLIEENKLNSSCKDLRFTWINKSNNKEYEIPYVIAGNCNTSLTLIWVKVPELYNHTLIYVYYKNFNAESESNVTKVFGDQLHLYLPFDKHDQNNLTLYDISPYSNDARITDVQDDFSNNATITQGILGEAVTSNDDGDGINITYTALNGANEVTFMAWIKTSDTYWGLLSSANSGQANEFLIYAPDSVTNLYPYIKGSYNSYDITGSDLFNNDWHLLSAVRDSSGNLYIYIDGKSYGSNSYTSGILSVDPNGLWLMQEQDAVGGGWDTRQAFIGSIDDVFIYWKALSLEQIQAYYNSTKANTTLLNEEYAGKLEINITTPNNNEKLTRYSDFWINSSIQCLNADCGNSEFHVQYLAEGLEEREWNLRNNIYNFTSSENVSMYTGILKLNTSDAPWWNDSWNYRRTISVSNSNSELINYSIKFTFDTATLISEGKMKSDCSDLRIVYWDIENNKMYEIPHYIESGCNTGNTIIWFRMPKVPSGTSNRVFVYYGNNNAEDDQDPEDTFEYFVNFSKYEILSAYGNQDATPSNYEVDNNQNYLHIWGNVWKGIKLTKDVVVTGDGSQILELDFNSSGSGEILGVGLDIGLDDLSRLQNSFYKFAGSQSWGLTPDQTYSNTNNWQRVYAILDDFSGTFTYIAFLADDDANTAGDAWFKNVRIRKYVSSEPTTSISTEEEKSFLSSGEYVSQIIDTGYEDVILSSISWDDFVNENTSVQVYTRSSNDKIVWSPWYLETNNSDVDAPDRRYVQVKVVLSSTYNKDTPYIYNIRLTYKRSKPLWLDLTSTDDILRSNDNPQICTLNKDEICSKSYLSTPYSKGNYTIRILGNFTHEGVNYFFESNYINISVYEDTYISELSVEPSVQYKGGEVIFKTKLLDSTGNPIKDQNISFYDLTTSKYLGYAITDAYGYATLTYLIPATEIIGTHTIEAKYEGNDSLFFNPSSRTLSYKVSDSPKFVELFADPEIIGTDQGTTIKTKINCAVSLDYVLLYLTLSNNTEIVKKMTYDSSTGYYVYQTPTYWDSGVYKFYVWANNTDSISNKSVQKTFKLSIQSFLDVGVDKEEHKNRETVYLNQYGDNWQFSSFMYRRLLSISSNESYSTIPVLIELNTSALISEGKMKSDCSDIKFVQENTIEEMKIHINNPYSENKNDFTFRIRITDPEFLNKVSKSGRDIRIYSYETNDPYGNIPDIPFYISEINDAYAEIWLKTDLPIVGKDLYIYYGNSNANSVSSYDDVFKDVIGEAGLVYTDNNAKYVPFKYVNDSSVSKAVFASINTYFDTDEAEARVIDVNSTGFKVYVEESASLDGTHSNEYIGYLVLKQGTWYVCGKLIQVASSTITNSYNTYSFPISVDSPIWLSQLQTNNGGSPAHTRMNNPSSRTVDIKIESSSTSDSYSATEDVVYALIPLMQCSTSNFEIRTSNEYINQGSDVSTSTSAWHRFTFRDSMRNSPVIVAKLQTENGGDNTHERIRNIDITGIDYAMEEEAGHDGPHTYEYNAYIAVTPNVPIIGVQYQDVWPSVNIISKKIIGKENVILPFYLESGCNTNHTKIWVNFKYIPQGTAYFYMYYGNLYASSSSTVEYEPEVFTYSNTKCTYVNLGLGTSAIDVGSYVDDNLITYGDSSKVLDKNKIDQISTDDGNYICSSGPISSGTTSSGDGAPLTPLYFKSKEFIYSASRYNPTYFIILPLDTGTIYVWNATASGWVLIDSFSGTKDSEIIKSYTLTSDTDGYAEGTVKINSTTDMLIFVKQKADDYIPLTPPNRTIIVEQSSYLILSSTSYSTNVNIFFSNGSKFTYTINPNQPLSLYTSNANDGLGPAAYIEADKPVFAYQLADSDGTEATPSMPLYLLDKTFLFPQDAEYFVVIAPPNNTVYCELRDPTGVVVNTFIKSNNIYPVKLGLNLGVDNSVAVSAGSLLICNTSVYVYYEYANNDAETLLYGPKLHKVDLETNISVQDLNIEEDKYSNLENNGQAPLKGYIYAVVQRYDESSNSWIDLTPAVINDRATNNLRTILPDQAIDLKQLWEDYGAWNTDDKENGKYRIYIKFEDPNGNVLITDKGDLLEDYSEFEIVSPDYELANTIFDSIEKANVSEYEINDSIDYFNISVKTVNNLAISEKVSLKFLDENEIYPGFGPDLDNYSCGDISENSICTASFENYEIPSDIDSQIIHYKVLINADNSVEKEFITKVYGNFTYQRLINIEENSGVDLINYPILILLNTERLIQEGKVKSDLSDIRFYDEDKELPYLILDHNSTTKVFVVPINISANSRKTIYLVYGDNNANAPSYNLGNIFEYPIIFDNFATISDSEQALLIISYYDNTNFEIDGDLIATGSLNKGTYYYKLLPTNTQFNPLKFTVKTNKPVSILIGSMNGTRPNGATYVIDQFGNSKSKYFLVWGYNGNSGGNLTIFVTEDNTNISVRSYGGSWIIENQTKNKGSVIHILSQPQLYEIFATKPVLVAITMDDGYTYRDTAYTVPSIDNNFLGKEFYLYPNYQGDFYIINPSTSEANVQISGCTEENVLVYPKSIVIIHSSNSLCHVISDKDIEVNTEIYQDVMYTLSSAKGNTIGKEFIYSVTDPADTLASVEIGVAVLYPDTTVEDSCAATGINDANVGLYSYKNDKLSGVCRITSNKPIAVYLINSVIEPSYTTYVPEIHLSNSYMPNLKISSEIIPKISIHNIKDTFNASLEPERIYQNIESTWYNLSLKNLWSKNITDVYVKINCPSISGLTCACNGIGNNICYLGNLSKNEEAKASFLIKATEDAPVGDYLINATINYTNPLNNYKLWNEVEPKTLEIRTYGILSISVPEKPTRITRGDDFVIKAFANNTADLTSTNVWLNYTIIPEGISILSGSQNVYVASLNKYELIWNNITFSSSQSTSTGNIEFELRSSSDQGQEDFKVISIEVFANTSLKVFLNDSKASLGEKVKIFAKLAYDNGTILSNKLITFKDLTDNIDIGSVYTNSSGIASIEYTLSSQSLGQHIIEASFAGDENIYVNPVSNSTTLNIGTKPIMDNIEVRPVIVGYLYSTDIAANVSDDGSIVQVIANITLPNNTIISKIMTYDGNEYITHYNVSWLNGTYNVKIIAKDDYDSYNESSTDFIVSINAYVTVLTEKDKYLPTEDVRLASAPLYPTAYKKKIIVFNNYSNVSEYQVPIYLNTKELIDGDKLDYECKGLRFSWVNISDNKEYKIPYYLDYGCNTNTTLIWVKVPELYFGNNTLFVYYGKNLESESNEFEVFSFNKNYSTFYVASSNGASNNLDVQAFLSNTWFGFDVPAHLLNNGSAYVISDSHTLSSKIVHDKPIFGAFEGDATDALIPISFAGKKFVYSVMRYTNYFVICSPFDSAEVKIYDSSNSVTTPVTTQFIANGTCVQVNQDITDNNGNSGYYAVIIESNSSILVKHFTTQPSDSRLFYPATNEVYGVVSTYLEVAALEDNTNVEIYCSDGTTQSATLNRGQEVVYSGFGSEGSGPACKVIADKPIMADTIADSDGAETTTFLPLKELDRMFVLPQPTQYVAIAVPFTSTTCTLYSSTGTELDSVTASPSNNAPGKIYFGLTTDGTNIEAGSYIICNKPVFAYYEYATQNDETQLLGIKANRRYIPGVQILNISKEMPSGSAVINNGAPFKGYLYILIQKNESNVWVNKYVMLDDLSTHTLRDFNTYIYDIASLVSSWNPEGELGSYRVAAYVYDNDGNILNTKNSPYKLYGYAYFTVEEGEIKLNITNIRIYEAPNNEHGGGTLVDSGLNKTFYLTLGNVYRIEFDISIDESSNIWNISKSNVSLETIPNDWLIDLVNNVWYLNATDSIERNGAIIDAGILSWNTSKNDGIADAGTNVTFYLILNTTQASASSNPMVFEIRTPLSINKEYFTITLQEVDTEPPVPVIYGLNVSEILRTETFRVYAIWNEEISESYLEMNSTISNLLNTTITPEDNSTNITISTSSIWLLGYHHIRIYAKDTAGNWNATKIILLPVYGLAYIDKAYLNNSNPSIGETVKFICKIVDDTNKDPISNYNVSFYYDGSYLGYAFTNSTGDAYKDIVVNTPGYHEFKCRIE